MSDTTRSLDRTPAQIWAAARTPVLLALTLLAAALVLAITAGTSEEGELDPRSVSPAGSRAVAEVLRDEGVTVELVTTSAAVTTAARAGDTVLVALPDFVVDSQVDAVLQTGADLVIVAAQEPERFLRGTAAKPGNESVRPPDCAFRPAQRAGPADAGRAVYSLDEGKLEAAIDDDGVERCYRTANGATLLHVRTFGRAFTFLGNSRVLTNDRLDDEGNAALALGLLGANDRLVWYLPSLSDVPAGEGRSLSALVPDGVWWGLGQAGIAVLLLALWRARRLGPVVAEPLPVIVRASETVEGRARLYRRVRARERAADALRQGVRFRLLPLLGLPRAAEPPAVIDAVAARTRRTAPEVAALLYGAAPTDDAALVQLADDLAAVEREVRRA